MSNLSRKANRDPLNTRWAGERALVRPTFRWHICEHCGWKAISLQTVAGDVQKEIKCLQKGCGKAVGEKLFILAEPSKEEVPFISLCWMKPNAEQFNRLPPRAKDYVRSGGLLMGRIEVAIAQ